MDAKETIYGELATPIIEHPDIQRLIKQAVLDGFKIKELQAENDNLKEAISNVPTHEFYEAQRDGLDANAAWDCFSEALSKWLEQVLKGNPNDG